MTPWYERNLFWGPVALGSGMVLTVVAAIKHDLRWLLVPALLCFLIASWAALRGVKPIWLRWAAVAAAAVVVSGGLYQLDHWLYPLVATKTAPPVPLQTAGTQPHAPIAEPLPHLIFSDSPAFTRVRKQRIEREVGAFKAYLSGVGFDVSRPIYPIDTRPGKGLGLSYQYPGSQYDGRIIIGENWLDNATKVRRAYAEYYFSTTVDDVNTAAGRSGLLDAVYTEYYLSSYSRRHEKISRSSSTSRWLDALWQIRSQFGADRTDKALCIGLQRRKDISGLENANTYTARIIELGFMPLLNEPTEIQKVTQILAANGIVAPSQ